MGAIGGAQRPHPAPPVRMGQRPLEVVGGQQPPDLRLVERLLDEPLRRRVGEVEDRPRCGRHG
jgi:hypothetical protein